MPDRYDVIIAGGGVIGASIAWRLARNRLRVLLLDAAKIGSEASSAAAGMLAPGGEFDQPSPLLDFAIGSLAKYDDFVAAIQADSGLPIEFRHTGAVQIALTNSSSNRSPNAPLSNAPRAFPPRFSLATNSARSFPGPPGRHRRHSLHRRSHRRSRWPDDRPSRRLPRARRDHPRAFARSNPSPAAVRVCSPSCPMRSAPFAVIAAGAWSGGIAVTIDNQPYALPRSFPMKGHLLGYRLPAGSLAATVRHDHTYVLQRADGFTIAGSSTEDAGLRPHNRSPNCFGDPRAQAPWSRPRRR
jgi:glycine oxidase